MAPAVPPRRERIGLDALSFFVADVQTGFGPFIAVYLATSGWSEGQIGQALSVGTIAAVISQVPGGALVDRLANKRIAVGASCLVVFAAALLFALSSSGAAVMLAEVLHSFGSSMLGPAIAALSLASVGRAGLGLRLGRNARFAALGNGVAAGVLGAAGSAISPRSVFWLTAAFMIPGLVTLGMLGSSSTQDPRLGMTGTTRPTPIGQDLRAMLTDARVLGFLGCIAMFHLANAALLPLEAANLAHRIGSNSNLVLAASVIVPQAIVVAISPTVGRMADQRGLPVVMALGFAAVPLRALLLAVFVDPYVVIAVQALDGISAATFGVLVPLVAAELTRGTARFNLCLGVFGLATSAGATVSTSLAGIVADHAGSPAAFLTLAGCGVVATLAALWAAPHARGAP